MKNSRRILLAVLVCTVLLVGLAFPATADIGPKPAVWISLENAPEVYYMDILIEYHEYQDVDSLYQNLYPEEAALLDETMIDALKSCGDETWIPGLTVGTHIPLFGSVVPGENGENYFGYFALPKSFRVAVATPDGNVKISDVVTMTMYQEHITLDYLTMSVSEQGKSILKSYVFQFLTTCVPTLIIELALMLAFGIGIKQNWYKILTVNVLTQLGLTVFLSDIFVSSGYSAFTVIPVFVFAEICITIFEALSLLWWIKDVSATKKILYSVAANAASAVVGGLLLNFAYSHFWIG